MLFCIKQPQNGNQSRHSTLLFIQIGLAGLADGNYASAERGREPEYRMRHFKISGSCVIHSEEALQAVDLPSERIEELLTFLSVALSLPALLSKAQFPLLHCMLSQIITCRLSPGSLGPLSLPLTDSLHCGGEWRRKRGDEKKRSGEGFLCFLLANKLFLNEPLRYWWWWRRRPPTQLREPPSARV